MKTQRLHVVRHATLAGLILACAGLTAKCQPVQVQPPRYESTFRVIPIASDGEPTPEGQAKLNAMLQDGWWARSIAARIAVLFTARRTDQPCHGTAGQSGA